MRKHLKLIPFAVLLMILLSGCTGSDANSQQIPPSTTTVTKITVSPVTVTDNRESIIFGNQSWPAQINATNSTYNKTVPDYVFEPNKTLFIFFINSSNLPTAYANYTNERQGEAILLKKGDADILIDSGVLEKSTYLVNFLRGKGVDDIELYISTHARPENYGGLSTILDNIEIEQFMWNGDTGGDAEYAALVEKAISKSRKTINSSYLMQIEINGINLEVLNPRDGGNRFSNINNDGIVLKITDRNFSLLTTGDIEYSAQTRLAESSDFNISSTVLQIPNYGLGQGTSRIDFFLRKVSPQAAIITGTYFDPGNEKYSIIQKLNTSRIPYYSTYNVSRKNLSTFVLRITTDSYNYSILRN